MKKLALVLALFLGEIGAFAGVLVGVLFGVFSIRANGLRTKEKLLEIDEFEKTILTHR